MVLEIAQLEIKPGQMSAFLAVMNAEGNACLAACKGCISARTLGGVEHPDRAAILVEWESLAAHEAARDSEPFQRFHALAGPFFGADGNVQHFHLR